MLLYSINCLIFFGMILWHIHLKKESQQILVIGCAFFVSNVVSLFILSKAWSKQVLFVFIGLLLLNITFLFLTKFFLKHILNTKYRCNDLRADFFSKRKVVFIVPHQDDDINLAGGVIEQYVAMDSMVSVVFCTNGDYYGTHKGKIRIREAVEVMKTIGVQEENVFFLGFGDQWRSIESNGKVIRHIYNSVDENLKWISKVGCGSCYGSDNKACYMECEYTRENYILSLERLISEINPDIIYATDYDLHPEHRATSLFFEEALWRVLKNEAGYTPTVYKGFCYRTAWAAPMDFAGNMNILSTKEPHKTVENVNIPYYKWYERVRVPVAVDGLDRFISKTKVYELYCRYASQHAEDAAGRVVSGDRVFWKRRTDSVLYDAEILVDGRQTMNLNDFKLLDSSDICSNQLDCGAEDVSKGIHIKLPYAKQIGAIGLYGKPDLNNYILAGYIEMDNGRCVRFGPLDRDGRCTYIEIPVEKYKTFSIHITDYTGTAPELVEIEAYTNHDKSKEQLQYFALVDEDDNFVYDYWMDNDTVNFTIYTYPLNAELNYDEFVMEVSGDDECTYRFERGILSVHCPKGKKGCIYIKYKNITNSIFVENPVAFKRIIVSLAQKLDYNFSCNRSYSTIEGQLRYYLNVIRTLRGKKTSPLS